MGKTPIGDARKQVIRHRDVLTDSIKSGKWAQVLFNIEWFEGFLTAHYIEEEDRKRIGVELERLKNTAMHKNGTKCREQYRKFDDTLVQEFNIPPNFKL